VIEGRQRTLYGRRRGKKLRAGQEALLDTLLPRLLVKVPPEPQKLALAASRAYSYSDHNLSWNTSGTNGHFAPFTWAG